MGSENIITLQFSAEDLSDFRSPGYFLRACGSSLIRWETWGQFSHVDAIMPDGKWLGARLSGGVKERDPYPVSRTLQIDVKVDNKDAFYSFLKKQIGKPYDVMAIIGFAARRDWETPDKWFCSELMASALAKAAPSLSPVLANPDRIDPQSLIKIVQVYMSQQ